MRPGGALVDREAGGAIAGDRRPARILEDGARFLQIGGEVFRLEGENPRVVIAMAGELVAAIDNVSDRHGVAFGDPTQREKGRLDPELVEQVEHTADVVADA